ncbi:MAG TPA: serine/threonine-protein kinase [Thermoanaerobaculia bacterium]|nr:serine/threonine-protein kinase [Thermoanaerobaculia bacterium]
MSSESEDTRVDRSVAGGPRRLGRFEAVRLLGRGGMGSVYMAEDRKIGRQVAIKEIRIERGVSATVLAEARVRFEVELRAAGRLSHPNIATVYDAFETEDSYCIALEYVPGISLDERLKAGPPLTSLEVAALAGQIASGLDYAHRRGIVHRDVKPGNILLSEEGEVKITDFGIAKLVALDVTQTGIALGTPAYMSPEQIRGETLDGRSDQFSLGVLLYQMLTGRLPFDSGDAHSMLYKIVHTEHERPSAINPALPLAVDRVFAKALAKDPANRYPTCSALAQELAAALAEGAERTAGPSKDSSPKPEVISPIATRRRALPWILGLIGVAGLLVLAAFLAVTQDWKLGISRPPQRLSPTPGVTFPSPAPTPPPVLQEPQNAGTPEPQPAVTGAERIQVEITSEPGRCHVTIDGRHAGFTPLTQALDPGKHQFTCEWPGQGKRSFEEIVSPERRRLQLRL